MVFKELFSHGALFHIPFSQDSHFQINKMALKNSVVLHTYN